MVGRLILLLMVIFITMAHGDQILPISMVHPTKILARAMGKYLKVLLPTTILLVIFFLHPTLVLPTIASILEMIK